MNQRYSLSFDTSALGHLRTCAVHLPAKGHVRFGSLADICGATGDVRFTPNSDRNRGHAQTVMSALPPKADMCGALAHVRFGPIADIVKLDRRSFRFDLHLGLNVFDVVDDLVRTVCLGLARLIALISPSSNLPAETFCSSSLRISSILHQFRAGLNLIDFFDQRIKPHRGPLVHRDGILCHEFPGSHQQRHERAKLAHLRELRPL
jgi:hypothetical protein